MTQEDKELLFKVLSAMLPYHVKVKIWLEDGTTEEGLLDLEHNYNDVLRDAFYYNKIKDIKPYLRPISSMTDDEEKEYNKTLCVIRGHGSFCTIDSFDYLISHGFDVYDLIPKGLAIEVTEENNPYKK